MAKIRIDITTLAELEQLKNRLGSIENVLPDIGEIMLLSIRENFDRQQSPAGEPWAPLKPATIARKRSRQTGGPNRKRGRAPGRRTRAIPERALLDTLALRDTMSYQVTGNNLEVGTPLDYGVYHQRGTRSIPARPWIGLKDADRKDILEIVADYLIS